MLIYDEQDRLVEDPDLTSGTLMQETRIKPNATPIDDVEKFAWDDDDYEDILRYHVYTPEELEQMRIAEEAQAKAEAREEFLESAPEIQDEIMDGLTEVAEIAATNTATNEEIMDALIELGDMVAALSE